MNSKPILIVDDEKNIRLTLSESLESLGFSIETAETGEEALRKIKEREYGMVLLDLRLPVMDGMEVPRQVHDLRPDVRIVVITAHGTIDSAIEAIRLGAVNFIQKPFLPQDIRDLVSRVMEREQAGVATEAEYEETLELARKCIQDHHLDAAFEHLRRAMYLNHARPEAFNLMGAVMELQQHKDEAHRHYLAAYYLDPIYEPAAKNIERMTSWHKPGKIHLGDPEKRQEQADKE